jgi:hypothetical protein
MAHLDWARHALVLALIAAAFVCAIIASARP